MDPLGAVDAGPKTLTIGAKQLTLSTTFFQAWCDALSNNGVLSHCLNLSRSDNPMAQSDERSLERIRAHYEVEKELAARLMRASREERRAISIPVHEELYQRITDHPLLTKKRSPELRAKGVEREIRCISRWLNHSTVFLELGCGDCAVSFAAAKVAKKVYGLDINAKLAASESKPGNFEFVRSDGVSVPVSGVTLAYSNQLMEHIHPDDAREQLQNIYSALDPGGLYFCVTPNRLTGPHDISRRFDKVATGFHLHEYTIRELHGIFNKVFRRVTYVPMSDGREFPVGFAEFYEFLCSLLPLHRRRKVRLPLVLVGYK